MAPFSGPTRALGNPSLSLSFRLRARIDEAEASNLRDMGVAIACFLVRP